MNLAIIAAVSTFCIEAAVFGSPVVSVSTALQAVGPAGEPVVEDTIVDEAEPPADEKPASEADAEIVQPERQLEPIDGADLAAAPVSNTPDNIILDEEQFIGPLAFDGESDEQVVARVIEYLEGVSTLKGDFTQIAPSGSVSTGQLYLRRPGLLRFEYDPPTPLLIVANGGMVYLRDEELETTDSYPVGRTPLKFLLRRKIDMSEAEIRSVDRGVDTVAVTFAAKDDETEGEISLIVSAPEMSLERWVVRDLQNGITVVSLENVAHGERLANRLFRAPDAGGQFLKN